MIINLLITKNLIKHFSYSLFFLLFIHNYNIYSFTKASEIKNNSENNLITTSNQKEYLESNYLLDAGDVLYIDFVGLDFYSGSYTINSNGQLILPEIDAINVSSLTLEEVKTKLVILYEDYIIDPKINVYIERYRPVTFFIKGEVKNPGLYTLNIKQKKEINQGFKIPQLSSNLNNFINDSSVIQSTFSNRPRLYLALQNASGVTNRADLSNIKILRKNSKTQGGGKIETTIDLLSTITEGDQSQNIHIFDGDTITIPKSKKLIREQVLAINKTNLNPNIINVFITGNVFKPGSFKLAKGSTLNKAIASTGGKKIMTGKIEFIRFRSDGSTFKNTFAFDSTAKSNSSKNPVLMDGDIINVRKTLLGSTTEVIREISSPVLGGYGLYKIFD